MAFENIPTRYQELHYHAKIDIHLPSKFYTELNTVYHIAQNIDVLKLIEVLSSFHGTYSRYEKYYFSRKTRTGLGSRNENISLPRPGWYQIW